MKSLSTFFKALVDRLQVSLPVGGLEISDSSLRIMFHEKGVWKRGNVQLVSGVMAEGRIKDKKALVEGLRILRSQILGPRRAKGSIKVSVVVCLGSVDAYTESFALPALKGENLEKAIGLNVKMSSPKSLADVYSGWQVVTTGEQDYQREVVAAFMDKGIVDEINNALYEAEFLPVVVEPRALSIARVLREATGMFDPTKPAVVVSVDANGVDMFIVRNGHLRFDYFSSWGELRGKGDRLSLDEFRGALTRNMGRILNFYEGRWKGAVSQVFVSATGLREEVLRTVQGIVGDSVAVKELAPRTSPPLSPDWFGALGGAMRGLVSRRHDKEISLLGVDALEEFRREQVLNFGRFWRVLMPASLVVLMLLFGGVGLFLSHVRTENEKELSRYLGGEETAEVSMLRTEVRHFNQMVNLIGALNASAEPKGAVLDLIEEITDEHGITPLKISLGGSQTVSFEGSAASQDDVLAFRDDVAGRNVFSDVNLPLTGIRTGEDGYSFLMSFRVSASKAD